MMFGLALFALSMWSFSGITHDWSGKELFLPQFLRGFPQVFAIAPAVTLGLGSLPPERLKYASGLFNMMRNLGGAIGIAVCATILNDRTNLHFLRLAEHLNSTNVAMRKMLNQVGRKICRGQCRRCFSRPRGGAERFVESHLPRGAGADVCRRVFIHRRLPRRRHAAHAVDEKSCPRRPHRRRMPIKNFKTQRFEEPTTKPRKGK